MCFKQTRWYYTSSFTVYCLFKLCLTGPANSSIITDINFHSNTQAILQGNPISLNSIIYLFLLC